MTPATIPNASAMAQTEESAFYPYKEATWAGRDQNLPFPAEAMFAPDRLGASASTQEHGANLRQVPFSVDIMTITTLLTNLPRDTQYHGRRF